MWPLRADPVTPCSCCIQEYTVDQQKTQWFSLYHSLQHYKYHTYLMCKDEVRGSRTLLSMLLSHRLDVSIVDCTDGEVMCDLFSLSVWCTPCVFGADSRSEGAGRPDGPGRDGAEVSPERSLAGGAVRALRGTAQPSAAGLPIAQRPPPPRRERYQETETDSSRPPPSILGWIPPPRPSPPPLAPGQCV